MGIFNTRHRRKANRSKSRSRFPQRRLPIEQLEVRALLAGTVTVELVSPADLVFSGGVAGTGVVLGAHPHAGRSAASSPDSPRGVSRRVPDGFRVLRQHAVVDREVGSVRRRHHPLRPNPVHQLAPVMRKHLRLHRFHNIRTAQIHFLRGCNRRTRRVYRHERNTNMRRPSV